MKESLILAVLALAIPLSSFSAEPPKPAPAKVKSIAVTIVGEPDTNLLNRVAAFVKNSCGCAISIKPAQSTLQPTPEKEAEELTKVMGTSDALLLALISVPEDVQFRKGTFSSQNVVFLNTWSLRPAEKMDNDTVREKYTRRVLKESLSSIGLFLGLPPCPFPRCCLSTWQTEQELDAKGLGFCPPCSIQAERLLVEKGLISEKE